MEYLKNTGFGSILGVLVRVNKDRQEAACVVAVRVYLAGDGVANKAIA